MAVNIGSTGEWDRLVSSNTIVIADFYADWCGPCKMIAPAFSSLATKHTKPGRIAFAKVNVDNHQSISSRYGVRAMPTFKVLKSGSVIDTIQGANPPALTAAIEKAVKLAGPGAAAGFTGSGRTLGGSGVGGGSSWSGGSGRVAGTGAAGRSLGRSGGQGFSWSPNNFFMALRTFIGLYIVSLFSLDPYKAAERSTFNINYQPPAHPVAGYTTGGGSGGAPKPAQTRPAFRTLADLGND